jgi:hypothetical protein
MNDFASKACRLTYLPTVAARIARLAAGLVWLAVGTVTAASAQGSGASISPASPPKAVLELYTSQGCSSCPPADALLGRYAQRDDIVALTLPVDYWDYLGWKDTLADPKFSARQRAYAKTRGDGRIYTPQLVVNGNAHVVGNSAAGIDRAIDASAAKGQVRVPITLRAEGAKLVIALPDGSGTAAKETTVWLAIVQKEVEVAIRSGENRGRALKYFNVVRELTPIGMWSGKAATFELARDTIRIAGAGSCAVLLQSGKGGEIVGAAMLDSGC